MLNASDEGKLPSTHANLAKGKYSYITLNFAFGITLKQKNKSFLNNLFVSQELAWATAYHSQQHPSLSQL